MGGVKKKPISQAAMEKKNKQGQVDKKKEKKPIEKKIKGLTLPHLTDEVISKELAKMGAITPYEVANKFNIRLGIAKGFLRDLESRNLIEMVSGNDRIRIYRMIGS